MKKQLTASDISSVIQKLGSFLNDLKARWDQENPGNRSWFKISRLYLVTGTKFIIGQLDEMILAVEGLIPEGADKKAAVMAITNKLFDYIVIQAFPIWLKPFAKIIKEILLNIVISHLIDFIVAKYNDGYWKMQEASDGEKV